MTCLNHLMSLSLSASSRRWGRLGGVHWSSPKFLIQYLSIIGAQEKQLLLTAQKPQPSRGPGPGSATCTRPSSLRDGCGLLVKHSQDSCLEDLGTSAARLRRGSQRGLLLPTGEDGTRRWDVDEQCDLRTPSSSCPSFYGSPAHSPPWLL